jgi:trans-aconitate 2-methyltransferase
MSGAPGARVRETRIAEWNADVYDRLSAPQVAWGQRVLERLEVRGDEVTIDAGCGTGRLTERLLERLPRGRVIAVDRSSAMLEAARVRLAPRFGERVSFVLADLQTFLHREPVDLVFSTATFHWVLDHARLFANLFASLRPGGRLFAQCGGGPNLARLRARFAAIAAQPAFRDAFAGFEEPVEFADPEPTAARLAAAGFTGIVTGLEPALTVIADPGDYRLFLEHIVFGGHLAKLADPDARRRFLDLLMEPAPHDDPPYSLDYWRLNLDGRRPSATPKEGG